MEFDADFHFGSGAPGARGHQLKQRYNFLKSQNCCFPDENGQSNCTIHDGEPVMQQRFVVVVIDLAAAVVTVVARSGDILE